MDPDLEALMCEFESIHREAEALTANLTDAQFVWKPAAGKWSVMECFAHLVIVDGTDLPGICSAIEDAQARGVTGRGPFRYGVLSGWFVRSMEPPVKRFKVSAPPQYVPPAVVKDPRETVNGFLRIQDEIRDLLGEADGLDLARVKVLLPVGPGLKMSLGRRFQLLAAHDRRHLWQAKQVLRAVPTA